MDHFIKAKVVNVNIIWGTKLENVIPPILLLHKTAPFWHIIIKYQTLPHNQQKCKINLESNFPLKSKTLFQFLGVMSPLHILANYIARVLLQKYNEVHILDVWL